MVRSSDARNSYGDAESCMSPSVSESTDLAEYRRPPVVEVAASIEFENIRELDAARLGLLWTRFRHDYPRTEQHPPLQTSSEAFELKRGGRLGFSVETSFPAPRLWFLNTDGTRLIQVQSNRLVLNWRELDTGQEYVRFSALRELLSDTVKEFVAFLQDEKLGDLLPDQVELTYVNHISARTISGHRRPLSDFVTCWNSAPSISLLGNAEETSFRSQYVLAEDGLRSARVFVELDSAYTAKDREPIYVLNLVARGAPEAQSVKSAFDFLDRAHEWIVNGFTLLTTNEAHQIWEQTT
jgi:uncharacterized protein (TIGR04255 family)